MRGWHWIGLALVLGGLVTAGPSIIWLATRGRRLTKTSIGGNGAVPDSPVDLAGEAATVLGRAVHVDDYSLARMIASEEGQADVGTKQAVAHVALNDLRQLGWSSVTSLLTYSTRADLRGVYGSQSSRRYSTARDPYEQDLQVAEAVRAGQVPDPTGGAVKFLRPLALRSGDRSLEEIEARWAREGLRRAVVTVPDLYFYRRMG